MRQTVASTGVALNAVSRRGHTASAAYLWGDELPLVGRRSDFNALRLLLDDAIDRRGHAVLLTGETGIGKSRLLSAVVREAEGRKMVVAAGRAFAVEAGLPYGALADALDAPIRALDVGALNVLTRGADGDLRAVVPGLPGARPGESSSHASADDYKTRLLWNVAQFLTRFAERQPLLLVLDNAHESDPSSLEFMHFMARHVRDTRILMILAYTDTGSARSPYLRGVERSLLAAREAIPQHLEALTRHDVVELMQRTFALAPADALRHGESLFAHTRGNPFFIEATLKELASTGRIRRVESTWVVESVTPETLPPTAREAVQSRLESLGVDARRVADVAAVVETRATLRLLERVTSLDAHALADAIDELVQGRILAEHRRTDDADYEFSHPIIQQTVRGSLSAARERALHASIATALEAIYIDNPLAHATAIARHLVRGHALGGDAQALRYLAAAGRDALERRAHEEARQWSTEALAIAERLGDTELIASLLEDVASALHRGGQSSAAIGSWERALRLAESRDDRRATARLLLLIGQESARAGNAREGLERLHAAEMAASEDPDLLVQACLSRAKTLQALGRHDEATQAVREALPTAEALGNVGLLARVHQTALQLYAWTGPATLAREHGARALALAAESGDTEIAWLAHWAMAVLEGFTGAPDGVARHQQMATQIADSLASPVLQAMSAEIAIEHASFIGRWDEALALAERTIPLARSVAPQSLLPRLLVWTGLIILARNETERARALFEEAWQLADAESAIPRDGNTRELHNVQNVILAHTGMGAYYLARGAWAHATDFGERGLALADRFGYVAWGIHRLIPLLLEAGLWQQDFARVETLSRRLREQSAGLGHRLGLAWANAADALVARLKYHHPDAAKRLLAAADDLDAVPFVFHAARLRRNAAQLLEADGDIPGAIRQMRRAHEVFARLGAEFELRETRSALRSLGVRLPPRNVSHGTAGLTGRELEIARAVARRLSNKQIGELMGISARTVGTHLSNVFVKLGVDSRGGLVDVLREHPLLRTDELL